MVMAGPGSGKTTVITHRILSLCQYTTPERIAVFTFTRKAAREMAERFYQMSDLSSARALQIGTFHSLFTRWLLRFGIIGKEALLSYDEIMTLMEKEADALRLYRHFDYFLIDEFQDMDLQQYEIIKKLCVDPSNGACHLFVVGDEDQAIYGFRGAAEGLFQRFLSDFPKAVLYPLYTNYRSDQGIVQISHKLIGHNQDRLKKELRASSDSVGKVEVRLFPDQASERHALARKIRQLQQEKHTEIALLCRTNQEAADLRDYLSWKGIAVKSFGGRGYTSEYPTIRQDLFLIKKLLSSGSLPEGKERERLYEIFPVLLKIEPLLGKKERLDSLQTPLPAEDQIRLDEIFLLRKALQHPWKLFCLSPLPILHWRLRKEKGVSIPSFLHYLYRSAVPGKYPLRIYTLHGAKGLEFDDVLIGNIMEDHLPYYSADEGQVEEERRLLYVGMTRARHSLYLSAPSEKKPFEGGYSRFLDEIML